LVAVAQRRVLFQRGMLHATATIPVF